MKIVKTIFFAGAILLSVASCDNLDDLNQNKKAYTSVLPSSLMASAQVAYAYFLTNASVNDNNFRGYAQYWTSTTYTDEVNYNQERRNLGNSHSVLLYRDVLQDLTNAQKQIRNREALGTIEKEIKKNDIAILDVQIIIVYQTLVDLFGNVPYTEALDIVGHPRPKYDDAKSIYLDLAARLDVAIADLSGGTSSLGGGDLIFRGNVGQWKLLANSVKLKLGLHLADIESAKAKEMVESAYNSGLMTNKNESALFKYYATVIDMNPLYNTLVNESQTVPTEFFVNELNAKDDPRRDVYFNPESKIGGVYKGAPYAKQVSYGNFSNVGPKLKEKTNPGVIFDYTETCFLLADAANRGFSVGGTAEDYYKKGILASMNFWGIGSSDAQTYLDRTDVAFTTAAGTAKQKIAYQLWIAYYNRGFEAWTEYRRLDYPILQAPSTAVDAAEGKVPVRNIYSLFDKTLNKNNYEAAATAIGGDRMTTKIFWDKF
ncbi:SusD-like starch-binding protein associating with outer membrane [Flavobacterium sp. 90]|uniref:SusD/RagB family nutrient-binding outer membrane lipoprotein n=1 Tax=unclassified Flavobacterium TaxID=196869 RepID=UPI000EAD766F|nr:MULTISPECIES: SusD/RagB family nutrient-binding outer membrane lipoprotein [unclassified Flavobacterium]RKR11056.1 SusD-like starch-binding protein associating with outer membrane [Flavobacterium sp. 81]TCK54839.1 SusD-like starch-binding protein associating with outer membrane [Flavobacterium sp. 90]